MSSGGTHDASLRRSSIRVALSATLVVAVVYALVSIAVMAMVATGLTGQIDAQISRAADGMATVPAPPVRHPPNAPERAGPFDPVIIVWGVDPDGTVQSSDTTATLPIGEQVAGPAHTATIGTEQVRLAGRRTNDGRIVIVGQSLRGVTDAQSTIILAEMLIAPFLLAAVFVGSVVIGRRVAAPIERARRRQLEFTADASHELRTPLSVIEAQTGLALSAEHSAAWYRQGFERVDRETKRMRRLVEDLLWLARFDSKVGHHQAEQVDLAVLAQGVVDRFTVVAETRGTTLRLRTGPGAAIVTAPAEWLDRLLGVLVDNGCKYAGAKGQVEVAIEVNAGRVRLTVEDSGPGIPPEERDMIFDRFHRGVSSKEGAGLGLAIGDAIVRASDGRWRVDQSPLGGASMAVSWAQSGVARG